MTHLKLVEELVYLCKNHSVAHTQTREELSQLAVESYGIMTNSIP
ncbi:MAG: hypothetical protein ACOH5I_03480 [Oligoflexus sp.]